MCLKERSLSNLRFGFTFLFLLFEHTFYRLSLVTRTVTCNEVIVIAVPDAAGKFRVLTTCEPL